MIRWLRKENILVMKIHFKTFSMKCRWALKIFSTSLLRRRSRNVTLMDNCIDLFTGTTTCIKNNKNLAWCSKRTFYAHAKLLIIYFHQEFNKRIVDLLFDPWWVQLIVRCSFHQYIFWFYQGATDHACMLLSFWLVHIHDSQHADKYLQRNKAYFYGGRMFHI